MSTVVGPQHGVRLGARDAALRTAGFVVLAVAMRPVGGWLCDRFPPVPVLTSAFGR